MTQDLFLLKSTKIDFMNIIDFTTIYGVFFPTVFFQTARKF